MAKNYFRQFRLDRLELGQLNREMDLIRAAFSDVSRDIASISASDGTNGADGADGAEKWELEFSMGYHGVGSEIIEYVDPANDGYFWFTPDTKANSTSISNEILHACEWRPEKSYSQCSLTLDVNDLNLGVHTTSVDIEVVVNSVGTGIGQFGMTSGSYHYQSGYVASSIGTGDTIGLRAKLHKNGSYPPSCPGPDSTLYLTAKIIYK